jgi:hypothetical protein
MRQLSDGAKRLSGLSMLPRRGMQAAVAGAGLDLLRDAGVAVGARSRDADAGLCGLVWTRPGARDSGSRQAAAHAMHVRCGPGLAAEQRGPH